MGPYSIPQLLKNPFFPIWHKVHKNILKEEMRWTNTKTYSQISFVSIQAKTRGETLANQIHAPIQRLSFSDQIICF